MKKLIALVSTISAIGFAVALAGTNEASQPGAASADQSQGAGVAGSDTSGSMTGSANGDMAGTTSESKDDKLSSAKTCTDENGVTYYKGKAGFESCLSRMKKEHKDQMGGTSPSDSSMGSSIDSNKDTTHPGSTDATNSGS